MNHANALKHDHLFYLGDVFVAVLEGHDSPVHCTWLTLHEVATADLIVTFDVAVGAFYVWKDRIGQSRRTIHDLREVLDLVRRTLDAVFSRKRT